jgi:hypothetical protein
MSVTTVTSPAAVAEPSVIRLNVMRAGYLFMAAGLVLVKWPLLGHAHTLPAYEGVTLCLLTAMSLLAMLGVRHPIALLPVLLFEAAWKVLWLSLVALPRAVGDQLDAETAGIVVNCSLVVVILVVIPWRYAWRRYVRAVGEPWT